MICTKCKKENWNGVAFCQFCGAPMSDNNNKTQYGGQAPMFSNAYMPAQPPVKKAFSKKTIIVVSCVIAVIVLGLSIGIPLSMNSNTSKNNNSYGQYGGGYINNNYGGNGGDIDGGNDNDIGGGNAVRFCGSCYGTGKCNVCHGGAICQVCFGRGGMSVVTYGQDVDDWVVCEGCKGNRKCKYCNGSGRCSSCGGSGYY